MKRRIVLIFPIIVLMSFSQESTDLTFLDDIPTKELPYIESTDCQARFTTLKSTVNEDQIKLLGLNKLLAGMHLIYSNQSLSFTYNVAMQYRLHLSDTFKTVVLSCYDWRVYTILINYKNEFDVIDAELIAFDFVDDRNHRISSVIHKDKLAITHSIGHKDSTLIYSIEQDGTINKIVN